MVLNLKCVEDPENHYCFQNEKGEHLGAYGYHGYVSVHGHPNYYWGAFKDYGKPHQKFESGTSYTLEDARIQALNHIMELNS